MRLFTESDDLICFLNHILLSSYTSAIYAVLVDSFWISLQNVDCLHYIYRIPSQKSGFLLTNKWVPPYLMSVSYYHQCF